VNKLLAEKAGVVARIAAMAPEREIFVRAGGHVRFVRISTRLQLTVAAIVLAALLLWIAAMGAMLWRQTSVSVAERAVRAQQQEVRDEAARANADKRSVDTIARDLEQRQNALDALMRNHFSAPVDAGRVVGGAPEPAVSDTKAPGADPTADPGADKVSDAAALSGTQRLAILRQRQTAFTHALTGAAAARIARVEASIRNLGLNPEQLAQSARSAGLGGPFIPAQAIRLSADPSLRNLSGLLDRLTALESALAVLPSAQPTAAPMESSSYGYRRDPFNGMAAFHAGVDFRGAYGQPILAASAGRVSFAGVQSGYGNCIEIDHGHGIMTRYAHLSGFTARVGDVVQRGTQIGRMGSTGRSTGNHLHFEVRINGAAVNPAPFLEARHDVFKAAERQAARKPA